MNEMTKEEWLKLQREELEKTIRGFTKKLSPEEYDKMVKEFTALHEFQWQLIQNEFEEDEDEG